MTSIGQCNEELAAILASVRTNRPLVHQITNYVTANDCANLVLAIGAAPIMADDPDEVCEIVALSSALVLNLGTLNRRTVSSMLLAGEEANRRGIPIILDPVGAGASRLRTDTAKQLTASLRPSVIRGNLSEIKALAGQRSATRGVDSADDEREAKLVATALAKTLGAVVAITGAQDVVTDGQRSWLIDNGHPWLARITGTGCMLSALVGACCGVSTDHLAATACAVSLMGLAGEQAAAKASEAGYGSFRIELTNAISRISPNDLKAGAKFSVE